MNSDVKDILQYFIKYENYSKFMNSSLSSIDGDHLPEQSLTSLEGMKETLDHKRKNAILRKLDSYPDIKGMINNSTKSKWGESVTKVLSEELDVEQFIAELPFRYKDNQEFFEIYVNQIINKNDFTICYPLMIRNMPINKKDRLVRPVITFKCTITEEGLHVSSFVMNRESLEIIVAEAVGCPIEDVRLIAAQTYKDLCTKIDSIKSSQVDQIINLIDQCLKKQLTEWNSNSFLDFTNYSGWLMTRRVFITQDNLSEMQQSIFRDELERLLERQSVNTSSLLNSYVLGNKQAVDYSTDLEKYGNHLGSYTSDYPVNEKQWRIVQSMKHAQLLAVNGPPGTGKTTLIKEMISDVIVRKASLLLDVWDNPWKLVDAGNKRAYYQSPLKGENKFSMIITSTNNKAVDNIGIELTNEVSYLNDLTSINDMYSNDTDKFLMKPDHPANEESENDLLFVDEHEEATNPSGFISSIHSNNVSAGGGLFCSRLGKKENMKEFRNEKLEPLLKNLSHSHIASLQNEEVISRFKQSLTRMEDIMRHINQFWEKLIHCLELGYLDEKTEIPACIERSKTELANLNVVIDKRVMEKEGLLQFKLDKEADVSKLEKQVRELESDIQASEKKRRKAYADKDKIIKWKRFPQSLLGFLPERKLFFTTNPTVEYIQETRIEPLTQQMNRDSERLKESKLQIAVNHSDLIFINEQIIDIAQKLHLFEVSKGEWQIILDQLLKLLEHELDLNRKLHSDKSLTGYSYYELSNATVIVQLRKQLFEEALAVNEQYVIKYHTEIGFNLEKMGGQSRWFQPFYSENGSRLDRYEKGIRAIWESFFLCFPVATTTLHSFSEQLFQPLSGLIDTLFVDEAGQIMPHYLCAPLFRSQKAIIVGDPEQLEPVRTFTLNLIEESNVREDIHESICILQNSAQDYADRGSEFYEFMGLKKKGIILNEHRRCEANIMRFSNLHVYNKMLLLTKDDNQDKLFGANLVAFDVRGLKDAYLHRNFSEITACQKIVQLLIKRYGTEIVNEIGIITPFSSQARELAEVITGVEIGTVHTFQGKEKRFIIFSSVIDGINTKNAGLSFVIGNKSNMLNVAFSRAKEQFIFVGNLETGLASQNNLAKAIQIIQQHGVSYSLFDAEYENESSAIKRTEAYAVFQSNQELNGIDSRLMASINELLEVNVLMNPKLHNTLLFKAIEYCRSSLGIVSPWVNSNVMNDNFFILLNAAKDRQADVRVRFGYSSSKLTLNEIDKIVERDNYSFKNKEAIKGALKELYSKLGESLVYMPPLHTKVLLIDNKILFIGSHNWLSNPGKLAREEISYLITDQRAIEYVKKRFDL